MGSKPHFIPGKLIGSCYLASSLIKKDITILQSNELYSWNYDYVSSINNAAVKQLAPSRLNKDDHKAVKITKPDQTLEIYYVANSSPKCTTH